MSFRHPRGHVAMSGDIFGCPGWWHLIGRGQGCSNPTRPRIAPTVKNYPVPDIHSAEMEHPVLCPANFQTHERVPSFPLERVTWEHALQPD